MAGDRAGFVVVLLLVAACGSGGADQGGSTAVTGSASTSVSMPSPSSTAVASSSTVTVSTGAPSSLSESTLAPSGESGLVALLEGVAWERSGIDRNCGAGEFPVCTQVVHDPSGAPVSYDPTTRTLSRHVRHDGEFVSATVPDSFGLVWLVAAGPDEVVYLNAVFEPGVAEGAADLVAMSLAPGDAGREVSRVVGGGNPGNDFDFVVTPDGLVTTGWYEQGRRPSADERLVMPWVDRDPTDDDSPAPGVDDTPNGVESVTIDAYERIVTINDRTWTLTGRAAEFPSTGMPPIAPTFDGGFVARYEDGEFRPIVVRGWPDGTVDEWVGPDIPPGISTVVPEPMGTVLIAGDDWFARVSPFEPQPAWDGRLAVDIDTGAVDVTELNNYLSTLDPNDPDEPWHDDPIAFAAATIGMPPSPAEIATIEHVRSTGAADTVIVTTEGFLDDSTYGTRWTINVRADLRNVMSIDWANTCQPQRGHQNYQAAYCT